MFDFYIKTKIKFGVGSSKLIANLLHQKKWANVGIVCDHNLIHNDLLSYLLEGIKQVAKRVIIGKCAISEPTYDSLEDIRKEFDDSNLQAIIGIGGGSALDMAKAIAVLVHNREPAIAYRGFDKMTEPVLPIIAVPTTAGTGSEITPNASFIDTKEKKKLGINGDAVRPAYAFLDPQLTLSCPKEPTISAGVDSLVHAVEAFVAKKSNPMARFFAAEGFRRVFTALPLLVNDLLNIDLREEVVYGAFLSSIALMHSGTGPAAALSYPMSVNYQVPHGLGGGIFLPHVIAHNIASNCSDYALLYNPKHLDTERALKAYQQEMAQVWHQLEITEDLRTLGVQPSDIDFITRETMELKGALDQNPVPFYEHEIKHILRQLTGGNHG